MTRIERHLRRIVVAALVAVAMLAAPTGPVATAHAEPVTEYQLKAALIFKLTRVFEWPDSVRTHTEGNVRVGVLGEDPFDGALEATFRDKRPPFGRGFEVVHVDGPEDALRCHMVFVPRAPTREIVELLPRLRAASILLVGEEARFAEQQGGILALVPDGRSLGMVLHLGALNDSGLEASSQFMRLCRIVGDVAR